MDDVITQYQRWKEQGEGLRSKAKQAMETRFQQLLSEAIRISEEYKSDFGGSLKLPGQVTAFRYKAASKGKGKKAAVKQAKAGPPAPPPHRRGRGRAASVSSRQTRMPSSPR